MIHDTQQLLKEINELKSILRELLDAYEGQCAMTPDENLCQRARTAIGDENKLLKETFHLVEKFRAAHPGEKIEITPHGEVNLVPETEQERQAWEEARQKILKQIGNIQDS